MKKVFTAVKRTYGDEFYGMCDTLEELKKEIVTHHFYSYNDVEIIYSEEMFEEACSEGEYVPYEIELHPDEEVEFHGYDGTSWFTIEKIDKKILSRSKRVYEIEEN